MYSDCSAPLFDALRKGALPLQLSRTVPRPSLRRDPQRDDFRVRREAREVEVPTSAGEETTRGPGTGRVAWGRLRFLPQPGEKNARDVAGVTEVRCQVAWVQKEGRRKEVRTWAQCPRGQSACAGKFGGTAAVLRKALEVSKPQHRTS